MSATASPPKIARPVDNRPPHHHGAADKPKHHSYSTALIALSLHLVSRLGLSRRLTVAVLHVVARYLSPELNIPSDSTVRNWKIKFGKHALSPEESKPARPGNWCCMADISIRVGGQRLLLVLGVDLNAYDYSHALTFADVKVLALVLRKERGWTAASIAEVLKQQVLPYYGVDYFCCDGGPNLRRAARDLNLVCIDDISHAFARALKRNYSQQADFKRFTEECTHLRRYNTISADHHLRPPALRGTARFMNISPLVQWAAEALTALDGEPGAYFKKKVLTRRRRQKLAWLLEVRELVEELVGTLKLMDALLHVFKHRGLSWQTVAWARLRLGDEPEDSGLAPELHAQLHRYLSEELAKCRALGRHVVLCSTDVVESYFGRYKQRVRAAGTEASYYSLQMLAYREEQVHDLDRVKEAMEASRLCELKEWHDSLLCQ